MNIFILFQCIAECVKAMADVHLHKMPLEAAQMLYATHYMQDSDVERMRRLAPTTKKNEGMENCGGMRLTHKGHPCTIWVQQCPANYNYLVQLALAMVEEYRYRQQIKKPNKAYEYPRTRNHLLWLQDNVPKFPKDTLHMPRTAFPQAVRDWIKELDVDVETAYRLTYIHEKEGKIRNFEWTGRKRPAFMDDPKLIFKGVYQHPDAPKTQKRKRVESSRNDTKIRLIKAAH